MYARQAFYFLALSTAFFISIVVSGSRFKFILSFLSSTGWPQVASIDLKFVILLFQLPVYLDDRHATSYSLLA